MPAGFRRRRADGACERIDSPAIACNGIRMKARITVTLKTGILDPQGKAIEGALKSLGVEGVESVRQGKVFDIELKSRDRKKAETLLKQAADRLLANTVIEDYRVEVGK
jgi:phosphoribosylformylglycinamidine synthase subunit PurS